jgi:hypothetical protein
VSVHGRPANRVPIWELRRETPARLLAAILASLPILSWSCLPAAAGALASPATEPARSGHSAASPDLGGRLDSATPRHPAGVSRLVAPRDRVLCTIVDRRIGESSGLVAAGDGLYTVNDGGERLRVYELDRNCRVRRVIDNGLNPYDVEDLARSGNGTLWLADIGDNEAVRPTIAAELLTEAGEATLFRFTYPDGPHDAEALVLDRRGRPYVVTKEPLDARVYTPARTPAPDRPTPLRMVASLSLRPTGTAGGPVGAASQVLATGGAVSADGTRLVLRTYTDAYVWSAPDGDLAAALRSGSPHRIPLPATRQGEAITFAADGRSLLTSTEGLPAAVHLVPLTGADLPITPEGPSTSAGRPTGSGADPGGGDGTSSLGNAAVAALLAAALVWGGGKVIGAIRR